MEFLAGLLFYAVVITFGLAGAWWCVIYQGPFIDDAERARRKENYERLMRMQARYEGRQSGG